MNTYLILFRIANITTHQNFENYLKASGSWASINSDAYLIKSYYDVATVRNECTKRVNLGDALVVINITKSAWATFNFTPQVNEWMKNNI